MSAENVAVVESIHAAFSQGVYRHERIADDIEYVNPPDAVEGGTRRGPESFDRIFDAYEDVTVSPERFVDAGDDVLVVARVTAVSRGARIPVERQLGYVWTVEDGRAVRFRWFFRPSQAFAALGIRDEGDA